MYKDIQGIGQQGRTVIYTNVKDACAIYTAFLSEPSLWDSLFRAALVAYLASEVALSLTVDLNGKTDLRMGMAIAERQIRIVKQKITEARIADGNEGLSSTDHLPDFMRVRIVGNGIAGGFGGQSGVLCGGGFDGGYQGGFGSSGWDQIFFCNGSVF